MGKKNLTRSIYASKPGIVFMYIFWKDFVSKVNTTLKMNMEEKKVVLGEKMTKSCGPIGLLRYLSSADDAHDPDSDKLSEISLLLFALSGRRSFSLFQYIHSQSKKGKIRNKIKDRVISYFQKGHLIS